MKKLIIIAGFALIAAGCYNDKGDKLYPVGAVVTCDTTGTISYANDVTPILAAHCTIAGCHDASGATTSGYDFTNFTAVQTVVTNNLLLGDINWETGHNAMPKGLAKLSDCDINKITRWVLRGARNN